MIRTTIAALAIAAPGVAILTTGTADAGSSTPAHDMCRQEDGSGQRVCVWDARHQGNGAGRSYIVVGGQMEDTRFVYISHRKAHRLTH